MSDSRKLELAVVLINLGTPDAPTPKAIRRYLKEFLSDPRVIDLSPLVWKLILNAFILPFRPRKLVESYKAIWTAAGAPLRAIGERQAVALQAQ